MEVNKKNYQSTMKGYLRKRKDQEVNKKMINDHISRLD